MAVHHRSLVAKAIVVLTSLFVLMAATAPAAGARTNDKTKRVLMIHGYDPFGTPTSSCDMWNNFETTMKSLGFTGAFTSVGYYDNQVSCDVSVIPYGSTTKQYAPSGGVHDRYVNIEHLGYEFAWMVYHRYSKVNQTVDVVAHSMGGLVVRYALAQVQRGHADFPPYLYVEDVTTMGTPHGGSGLASWCWTTQCGDMAPNSSFLNWLTNYGPNPQVGSGTDWTAMASYDDEVVSESSAVNMNAAHKVQYTGAANIGHGDYYNLTSKTNNAPVRYQDNGGSWYSWSAAPWPVKWTGNALYLGTW